MIGRAFLATFRTILSDRAALTLLVVSAVLYSFFYPSAYSGEIVDRVPALVVDMDNSDASHGLIRRLSGLQQVRLVGREPSPAEGLRRMKEDEAGALIVVPPGFERRILRGDQGKVALYGNGAFLLRSNVALTGIAGALTALGTDAATRNAMAAGAPAGQTLRVIARPLFNTREGYGSTVVPAVAFVIVHQTLLLGLALLAGTMRERQGRLGFAPGTLAGVALAFFVLGWADLIYFTGFVFWFQDYPRAQAGWTTLLVGGSLFVAAIVAGALMLASLFRTRERPVQIWIVTSLPIYFLSGISWPVEAWPRWLAAAARLLPTTPGIRVMVASNQMGADLRDQLPDLLNLAALAVGYGAIAAARLVRRPAS